MKRKDFDKLFFAIQRIRDTGLGGHKSKRIA